jgi:outer membrane receptor for ferrienterochelin and colicin
LVVHRTTPIAPGDPYTQADYAHAQITAPSFNTGLVWQPTSNDTFRELVGRGVQAPSLVELGLDVNSPLGGGITRVGVGDPYLNPSVTMNYEIDYDRVLAPIESTLSTAFYYSTVQDLLTAGTVLPGTFTYPYYVQAAQNFGNGQVYGTKLVLKGSDPSGLRWNLGYTLTAVRAHMDIAGPPATPYDFNNATPVSAIVFGFGYSWNKFEADLQGKWQSRYTDVSFYVTPAGEAYEPKVISNFVTLDARIAYNVTPHLVVAVTGDQLQSSQTIVSAGPEVDRRVLFTGTYNF